MAQDCCNGTYMYMLFKEISPLFAAVLLVFTACYVYLATLNLCICTKIHTHCDVHKKHNLQVMVLLIVPLPHLLMRLTVIAYSFNGSTLGITYIADDMLPEVP